MFSLTDNMSEPTIDHADSVEDEELDTNYKPPPEKTIEQIMEADKEDESLRKYKETLLGEAKTGAIIVGELQCLFYFVLFLIN